MDISREFQSTLSVYWTVCMYVCYVCSSTNYLCQLQVVWVHLNIIVHSISEELVFQKELPFLQIKECMSQLQLVKTERERELSKVMDSLTGMKNFHCKLQISIREFCNWDDFQWMLQLPWADSNPCLVSALTVFVYVKDCLMTLDLRFPLKINLLVTVTVY